MRAHRRALGPILAFALAAAALASAGPASSHETPEPDPAGFCGFLEQAHRILSSLKEPPRKLVLELSRGLVVERNLRIQEGLLREHLTWEYDELTPEQTDLLIFTAVALRLERVGREIERLRRGATADEEGKPRARLETLELYRVQALALLNRLSPRLKRTKASEVELGS